MRDAQIPTVTELVKRAQVTRNTVYNWEGGKSAPALDELDKVAQTLGVPLSHLVDAWAGRQAQQNAAPDIPERLDRIEAKVDAIPTREYADEVGQTAAAQVIAAVEKMLLEDATRSDSLVGRLASQLEDQLRQSGLLRGGGPDGEPQERPGSAGTKPQRSA